MTDRRTERRAAAALLALAFAARLLLIVSLPAHTWFEGGDGPWYVRQGWLLERGALDQPPRTVGPLYPLALALAWNGFPGHVDPADPAAVSAVYLTAVRLLQAALGTATAALVLGIARRMQLGHAAFFAAVGVGLGPAFVIEPFMIRTETLFILLVAAAVWIHLRGGELPGPVGAGLAGVVAALAALTRPVFLPFPIVLAALVVIKHGWRHGVPRAATLVAAATLMLAPWHVALYRSSGIWLPEGFSSNLWIATQDEGGPLTQPRFHELEGQLRDSNRSYLDGAFRAVLDDPGGWAARRGANLLGAVLQPHGTSDLGGASTKERLVQWASGDRSVAGLWQFAGSPAFVMRLLVYLFHYSALVLAAGGLLRTARHWRDWLPIYAAVLYFPIVHVFLMATPRYLFPIQPFLWVLAAAGAAGWRQAHPRTPRASP
jgi:4-amino-4-deoxy-L-arabinose transferase-like glycosyltransferase